MRKAEKLIEQLLQEANAFWLVYEDPTTHDRIRIVGATTETRLKPLVANYLKLHPEMKDKVTVQRWPMADATHDDWFSIGG
jgi:hypothetical protein